MEMLLVFLEVSILFVVKWGLILASTYVIGVAASLFYLKWLLWEEGCEGDGWYVGLTILGAFSFPISVPLLSLVTLGFWLTEKSGKSWRTGRKTGRNGG